MKRLGACNRCGRCCKTMLWNFPEPADEDMIELLIVKGYERMPDLKLEGRAYRRFARADTCPHLDPAEGRCVMYARRPRICRHYPRSPLELLPGCGFRFVE